MKTRLPDITGCILAAVLAAYAADFSGIVVDRQSGDPVEGVLVSVGHSQNHTRTDAQGRFDLSTSGSSPAAVGQKSVSAPGVRWDFRQRTLDLSGAHGVESVGLYGLDGRCVHTQKVPAARKIAFPSLAEGVYVLRLEGVSGERTISRVVFTGNAGSQSLKVAPILRATRSDRRASSETTPYPLIFRHDNYYPYDLPVTGSVSGMRISLDADERSLVFDETKVRTYRFTVNSSDSLYLETYGHRETYVPAQMTFEDEVIGTVGLRYKGSSYSIPNCFDTINHVRLIEKEVCRKISFKVKFNKYESDKRFHGMKRLNLHSMSADQSKMHDVISYELFRKMGIHSPRTAFVNIFVNDRNLGLFVAVENIDGRFTDSRWPAYGNGNLYKEVWPTNRSESAYLGALKTNGNPEDNPDVAKILAFSEVIESSTEENFIQNLYPYVDFDYLLRYIAVDRAIKNWDGIMGWYTDRSGRWAGNHNFFIYEEQDPGEKFWLIPWDMDNTLWSTDPYMDDAGVPNWNENVPDCEPMPVWGGSSYVYPPCYDKFTRLLAKLLWDEFVSIGEEFLEEHFEPQQLRDKVDAYSQLVSPVVAVDPVLSHEDWLDEVDDLKRDFTYLYDDFSDHLRKIKKEADTAGYLDPFPYDGNLRPDVLNNFEFTPVDVDISDWSYTYSSRNSITNLVHSTQTPLYGTADVLFSFELVSSGSSSGWSEWSGFGLQFPDATDLSALREIQISLSSDVGRNVRITVQSDIYEEMEAQEEYGWDVQASPETKTVILQISRMNYPSWGDPNNPDIKEEVLREATGVAFAPSGRFDGTGDLVRDPDIGFLRVDNIRFVYE
ncbi:MAG: CotH kinase family protein [Chitinispirillaceae bacterium]